MDIHVTRSLVPVQVPMVANGPLPVSKGYGVNLCPDDRSPDSGAMKFIGYGTKEKHRVYGPSGRATTKGLRSGRLVDLYV